AAPPGENLNYILTYRNNSNVTLENVVITAAVTSEMVDFTRARSHGYLNSLTNTFTWNQANTPALAQVTPGKSDDLDLALPIKKDYPIKRLGDKNYSVKLHVQIESPTVPENTGAAKTVSVTDNETKVAGRTDLNALGFYVEKSGFATNTGPYPPKVNTPTQYTVHWRLTNYSTDLSNVHVSAFLQNNTHFTGLVTSTINYVPKFNAASGEMSWDIPNLPAGKGLLGDPVEAIFQLENTPAVNDVGGLVEILGETKLTANDDFTGQSVLKTDQSLNTGLPDDVISSKNKDVNVQP
ncbi:MAG TPA: hypothetical protein VMC43_03990, partial [Candidatus Paceibacterota bacterium]|nr:hypothetical protein [Candidatus Paceibacterota bacterium]